MNTKHRLAIAEFCGWKRVPVPEVSTWGFSGSNGEFCFAHQLPDYCNDMNAIHEAEAKLTTEQLANMDTELYDVTSLLFVWRATAAQRAEALLRTIGRWDEQ